MPSRLFRAACCLTLLLLASGARGQRLYLDDDVQNSFGVSASAAIAGSDVSPGASVVVSATRWLDAQVGVARLTGEDFTSLSAGLSVWLSPSGPTRTSLSATVQTLPLNSGEFLLSVGGAVAFPRQIASGVAIVPQAGMTAATPTRGGLAPEVFFAGTMGAVFDVMSSQIVFEPAVAYAVVDASLSGGASVGLVVPF